MLCCLYAIKHFVLCFDLYIPFEAYRVLSFSTIILAEAYKNKCFKGWKGCFVTVHLQITYMYHQHMATIVLIIYTHEHE